MRAQPPHPARLRYRSGSPPSPTRGEGKRAHGNANPPLVPADAGTQSLPKTAAKKLDSRFRGNERSVGQVQEHLTAIVHRMLDRAEAILAVMAARDAERDAAVCALLCAANACKRAQACRHRPCTALGGIEPAAAWRALRACVSQSRLRNASRHPAIFAQMPRNRRPALQ